ncbi:MAG: 50S ribosomal protein L24 [Desulfobacteraceae bacterium]|nr:50S ribosomal protein L24 [Desulfobacteraceae bacterium]MBC2756179.1 50S ribosomal protein L24 [Desulfobacteraceae bacterium]
MEKNKCHIKKNDKVKVITGKDNGKIGKVIDVLEKKNRLLIENVNMVKRHTRPSAANKQGGIVEGEAAIHWSNVLLMCNKCIAPVRIKMRRLEDGKKVRVCRKCNEIIDA